VAGRRGRHTEPGATARKKRARGGRRCSRPASATKGSVGLLVWRDRQRAGEEQRRGRAALAATLAAVLAGWEAGEAGRLSGVAVHAMEVRSGTLHRARCRCHAPLPTGGPSAAEEGRLAAACSLGLTPPQICSLVEKHFREQIHIQSRTAEQQRRTIRAQAKGQAYNFTTTGYPQGDACKRLPVAKRNAPRGLFRSRRWSRTSRPSRGCRRPRR